MGVQVGLLKMPNRDIPDKGQSRRILYFRVLRILDSIFLGSGTHGEKGH